MDVPGNCTLCIIRNVTYSCVTSHIPHPPSPIPLEIMKPHVRTAPKSCCILTTMRSNLYAIIIALLISRTVSTIRELHIGADHEDDHYYSLISAANFDDSSGVEMQVSSEGIRSIRYLNIGDYTTYQMNLAHTSPYLLQMRVSSPSGDGNFELVNIQTQEVLATIGDLEPTGDWNQWTTLEHGIILPGGSFMMQIKAIQPGWELLWISLLEQENTDASLVPSTESQVPIVTSAPLVSPTVSQAPFAPNIPLVPTTVSRAPAASSLPMSDFPTVAPSSVPSMMPTRPEVVLPGAATGFVHAHERLIVGPDGNKLQFKGMILGGWMVLQPYLVLAENYANTSSEYFALVKQTIGEDMLMEFRQSWLENFVTQEDVRELKSLGFNLIKAPLHYELFTLSIQEETTRGADTWLVTGFDLVDQLLEWAAEEEIYVLLDLQAAPGGQNYDNATDYDPNLFSFWQDGENQRKTISLWREIAIRYADNPWVAGYDLLDSVGWNFDEDDLEKHQNGCDEETNIPLRTFYDGAINAIRDFDTNHMIVIAGNCWGTNHKGLFPMDDDNVALGFRMSWIYLQDEKTMNFTPQDTIFQQLFEREKYNIPLLMTHAGDFHNKWYSETTSMLESNDIAFTWWTWKKMNSTDSPFEVYTSTSYNTLLTHWDYECDNIHVESAFKALMQIATNTRLSKTRRNRPVIEALMNTPRDCDSALEYVVTNSEPRRIEAEDYCSASGIATENGADVDSVGSNVGWLNLGSFILYKLNVAVAGTYKMTFRLASPSGDGGFTIESNGVQVGQASGFTRTFGWQSWTDEETLVDLPAGIQVLSLISTGPGWNLNWFELSFSSV